MANTIVRPARLDDRESVDALLARSYPPLLAPAYEPEVLAVALPGMTRANSRLLECPTWFVAVDETGRVLGCGGWTREQPGTNEVEPGVGHLRHFGTDIDHLRRGIARAIIARSLATARAAGINRMDCYSTLVAERFYASQGFRTLEPMNVAMPRPDASGEVIEFPAVLMRCVIA